MGDCGGDPVIATKHERVEMLRRSPFPSGAFQMSAGEIQWLVFRRVANTSTIRRTTETSRSPMADTTIQDMDTILANCNRRLRRQQAQQKCRDADQSRPCQNDHTKKDERFTKNLCHRPAV
jgi:hypothetical protein